MVPVFLRRGVWVDVCGVLRERSEEFSLGRSGFDVPIVHSREDYSGRLCL